MSQQTRLNKVKLIDGVVATGAGDAFRCQSNVQYGVQVSGITTATVTVEVSNDKTNWVIAQTFTEDGADVINGPFIWIRGNVTVWTSGTIDVDATI